MVIKKNKNNSKSCDIEPRSWRFAVMIVITAQLVCFLMVLARKDFTSPAFLPQLMLFSALGLIISASIYLTAFVATPLLKLIPQRVNCAGVLVLVLLGSAIGTELTTFILYKLSYIDNYRPEGQNALIIKTVLITAIVAIPLLRYILLSQSSKIGALSEKESQMQALHSRIRPHFLYNSLNSVASLTRSDPDRAEAILHNLADLFRVLLADARKLVPITAEQEISKQYLEVEKIRLGDRLNIIWSVNNIPPNAQIPALTLQPLLENAIYHGIEPRFGGGTITIRLWTEGNESMNIMISNPIPEVVKKSYTKGNQIAQDNIRMRLETHFGEAARMQSLNEGGQYHVKIRLPLKMGG